MNANKWLGAMIKAHLQSREQGGLGVALRLAPVALLCVRAGSPHLQYEEVSASHGRRYLNFLHGTGHAGGQG